MILLFWSTVWCQEVLNLSIIQEDYNLTNAVDATQFAALQSIAAAAVYPFGAAINSSSLCTTPLTRVFMITCVIGARCGELCACVCDLIARCSGNITKLSWNDVGLAGSVATEIGLLTALTSLRFDVNYLRGDTNGRCVAH
jgi:hypothetical protein